MLLNHITHVPFFTPSRALSPAGSSSFLFYLFRLSTAVLEARRDFAAIYFMCVTSFSALSLLPTVAYLPTLAISFADSPSRCSYRARQRPTHTRRRTNTHARRVYVQIVRRRVRFYRRGGPECSLLHLFRANSPLKTAYASYYRLPNRLAFFLTCCEAVLVKRLRVNSVKRGCKFID